MGGMELTQYAIVLVNLDPTIDSEIKKTRPCVIISPDEMNDFLNTVIVAPITSKIHSKIPTRIEIELNQTVNYILGFGESRVTL